MKLRVKLFLASVSLQVMISVQREFCVEKTHSAKTERTKQSVNARPASCLCMEIRPTVKVGVCVSVCVVWFHKGY